MLSRKRLSSLAPNASEDNAGRHALLLNFAGLLAKVQA
jgi:hypothetical protein